LSITAGAEQYNLFKVYDDDSMGYSTQRLNFIVTYLQPQRAELLIDKDDIMQRLNDSFRYSKLDGT